jgi:VanZ family protein
MLAPVGGMLPPTATGFMYFDKMAHLCLFTVTAFLGIYCASHNRQFTGRILFGAVFSLVVALVTEFGQSLVPYRDTSLYDLLADYSGLAIGVASYTAMYKNYALRAFFRL